MGHVWFLLASFPSKQQSRNMNLGPKNPRLWMKNYVSSKTVQTTLEFGSPQKNHAHTHTHSHHKNTKTRSFPMTKTVKPSLVSICRTNCVFHALKQKQLGVDAAWFRLIPFSPAAEKHGSKLQNKYFSEWFSSPWWNFVADLYFCFVWWCISFWFLYQSHDRFWIIIFCWW